MDIDDFYDADPRRRRSEEQQFGQDWHDARGCRYEINWVQDTGELYAMSDEPGAIFYDPFGDVVAEKVSDEALGVRVIARIASRADVDELMRDWSQAMSQADSIRWLTQRISANPNRPA